MKAIFNTDLRWDESAQAHCPDCDSTRLELRTERAGGPYPQLVDFSAELYCYGCEETFFVTAAPK